MKLQTSYFNTTVLKKNLSRFAPVWVLYTLFWLVILSVNLGDSNAANRLHNWLDLSAYMSAFNMLYAGLCALTLFGDLWNARLCNALHAMPMRREGWLLTHSLSAILFALIPYVLTFGYTLVLLPDQWDLSLVWLGASMMEFVFFFGLAAFCSLCAGNRLGMVIVYCLLNFFFLLVFGLYELLYQPLLSGIKLDMELCYPLIPVVKMSTPFLLWQNRTAYIGAAAIRYILICGGFGFAFWLLSFLLYRRRKLESAGDLIAFTPMAPVFLVCYTLGCGAFLHLFADALGNDVGYAFLGLGITIGFFTGKMLLDKTVRVFNGKAFLGLGILAAVLVGSLLLTKADPLGVTRKIPDSKDIYGARIYSISDRYIVGEDWAKEIYWMTGEEDISQITQMHQKMIDLGEESPREGDICNMILEYKLTNGTYFRRYYSFYTDTTLGKETEALLSDWRNVLFTTDLEAYVNSVTYVEFSAFDEDVFEVFEGASTLNLNLKHLPTLISAIKADCEAGALTQDWSFDTGEETVGWIYLQSSLPLETDNKLSGYRNVQIRFGPDCQNIIAFLDSLA